MRSTLFSPFQLRCIELLDQMPKTQSRHCVKSALHHLERAERLRTLDPAMAMFRAITAEEEAASGLIWAIRERKYPKAQLIDPRDHRHKHAVTPFFRVVDHFLGNFFVKQLNEYTLRIDREIPKPRLQLSFRLRSQEQKYWATPMPPFNFALTVAGEPPKFKEGIRTLLEVNGASDILAFLRKEVTLRNRILYATSSGFPVVTEVDNEFIEERRDRVFSIINAYLLIRPYPLQTFVSHVLSAFVDFVNTNQRIEDSADAA